MVLKWKKKKENVIRKWNQNPKHDKWSLGFTQVHRCGRNHAMCSPKSFFFLPSCKDTPYFPASSSVWKAMWLGSHQWNCGQKRWMLLSDPSLKHLSLSLLPCLLNAEDSEQESKGLRDGKASLEKEAGLRNKNQDSSLQPQWSILDCDMNKKINFYCVKLMSF